MYKYSGFGKLLEIFSVAAKPMVMEKVMESHLFKELKRVRSVNCFQPKGYHIQWDEAKADNLLFSFAQHPWSRNITLAIFTSQEVGKGLFFL